MTGPSFVHTLQGPLVALVVAPLVAIVVSCGEADRSQARHVLLITLDTTRADHLSCYGSARNETPALDALAREGVRFEDCTSAAATTLSSHTSLMTGTYPHRHGVVRNGFSVDPGNRLLAQVLRDEGFWCAAVVGSSALVARTGLDAGFHVYDDAFDMPISPGGADQEQRLASGVTDAMLGHVDDVLAQDGGDEARLFLFAHYFDPHAPYAPPADLMAGRGVGLSVGDFDVIEGAVRAQQKRVLGEELGQQAVISRGLPSRLTEPFAASASPVDRALAELYAAEVTAMDREIGRLLLGLASRGLLADTLVVVTADHGETFWEHGNFWNHGLWVSQTDVHVPLIVRLPHGDAVGGVVSVPVSGVDVAPTILDALGLLNGPAVAEDTVADATVADADAAVGRSLLPALHGEALATRALFTEATQPGPSLEQGSDLAWRGARKPHAVRLGRWKLIKAPYLEVTRLFDLETDPDESVDLLAGGPLAPGAGEALAELELALARWIGAARPRPSTFDRTQARSLGGLGYAEALGSGAGEDGTRPR